MSNIMHMSEASLLGLHAMMLIASNQNKLINVKSIADKINASENHLAKVMQRLVKSGLIFSVRGPSGGFKLEKDLEEITLLDIYEAIDGKFEIHQCMLKNNECPFNGCIFGNINKKLSEEFYNFFKTKTLKELI